MKQSFTKLCTLILIAFLSYSVNGQVTMNLEDFPRQAAFTDTFYFNQNVTLDAPQEGPDQYWDFSGAFTSNLRTRAYTDETDNPDFPDALNSQEENLSFQAFIIPNRSIEGLDANGYFEYGAESTSVIYPIGSVTGSPTDSLAFPGQKVVFQQRLHYVQFPLTYGKSWSENTTELTGFELTVAGFGLNQVPGYQKRYYTQTRRVVGYGKVVLPRPDGSSTQPMDALMIKVNRSNRDSFFLGGALAPAPLMVAFGLSQGRVASDSFYVFYGPGFGAPICDYDLVDKTIAYRPQAEAMISSANAPLNPVVLQTFPNPVGAGQEMTVAVGENFSEGFFQLVHVNGTRVMNIPVQANRQGQLRVILPADLNAGMYFMNLLEDSGKISGIGKLMLTNQ